MMTKIKYIHLLFFLFVVYLFHRGLAVADSGTFDFTLSRMTYDEGEKSISIGMRNKDASPYLVQANMKWINESTGLSTLDKKENPPFIVTPLLTKIEPNEYHAWVVKYTGSTQTLPNDRESMYLAQFRLIPSTSKENNDVQFTLIRAINFKVYFRPKPLVDLKIVNEQKKLDFTVSGNKLVVKNNSPIYLAFETIKVNGNAIYAAELAKNVPPFSSQAYQFEGSPAKEISWQILDEFLFPLDIQTKKIQ